MTIGDCLLGVGVGDGRSQLRRERGGRNGRELRIALLRHGDRGAHGGGSQAVIECSRRLSGYLGKRQELEIGVGLGLGIHLDHDRQPGGLLIQTRVSEHDRRACGVLLTLVL